jgi:hypothetical protein
MECDQVGEIEMTDRDTAALCVVKNLAQRCHDITSVLGFRFDNKAAGCERETYTAFNRDGLSNLM